VRCRSCGANPEVRTLNAEIAIHFSGLDALNKPIVWVFPKIVVCLDCGFAEFSVPDEQRKMLRERESRIARGGA